MENLKTVEDSIITNNVEDPLYKKQKDDVNSMRSSLLLCTDDSDMSRQALQKITVLRVYHQVSRIIRYLEMMDKIENKLYETLDNRLDSIDVYDNESWMVLMQMQEHLQKTMIESQKLLAPYIELTQYTEMPKAVNKNPLTLVMDSEKRENLRKSAQQVLLEINAV